MQNRLAGKRMVSLALAVIIAVGLLPTVVFAASIPDPTNVRISDRGNQHASFQWDWPGEQRKYEIVLYKEGTGEILRRTSTTTSSWTAYDQYYIGEWGLIQKYGSGKYYYTLQYLGNTPAENSNVITSNTYNYTDPGNPAPTPSNLRWEEAGGELFLRWDYKDYDPDIYESYLSNSTSYMIRIYRNGLQVYGEPEDTTSINSGSDRNRQPWSDYEEWLDGGFASGDYTFTVQIRSRRINIETDSAISSHSPVRSMGTGSTPPPATPVISITSQPLSEITVTENHITQTLSAAAIVSNGSTPSYQWYSNTMASNSGGSPIPGATGAVYAIPTDLTTGVSYYFCEVSAANAASVRSNVAKVIVNPDEPPVVPAAEPTAVWDDPIQLDMGGVKTAYINVSLGSSGVATATEAAISVKGSSVTVSPDRLAADGNIRVTAAEAGTSELSIVFHGVDERYNKTATVTVADSAGAQVHTITASAGSGGSITPSGAVAVDAGGEQAFTITPNSGYRIDNVLVDGVGVGAASSYTFAQVDDNHTIHATFAYAGGFTGGSSSGGSGRTSGGSGRVDGSAAATGSAGATAVSRSGNVSSDGSVNAAAIKTELDKAINAAAGDIAAVRTRNAQSISPAALRTMAGAAAAANKTAILHADTMSADGKVVQGRLYVDPAKLTGLSSSLKLGVYTQDSKTAAIKRHFEKYYANRIAVIAFDQQGSLGARLQVAAKVDVSDMDTANLVFYSYDKAGNRYQRISNPAYFIDSSGYLHFHTEQGGSIVVSSGELQKS